jgi:hypothetical protein
MIAAQGDAGRTAVPVRAGQSTTLRMLVRVRRETEPCSRCGAQIEGGWLYVVGPPPRHVSCPSPRGIER